MNILYFKFVWVSLDSLSFKGNLDLFTPLLRCLEQPHDSYVNSVVYKWKLLKINAKFALLKLLAEW